MSGETSAIGRKVLQKDGRPRVTGEARYYSDFRLPGTVHARLLRSPHGSAEIVRIDTSRAEAQPGVHLVMTHLNFPQVFRKDLHYAGEHVAAVVADSDDEAESALNRIEVEYEPRPFVLGLEEALEPDAPRVFPGEDNRHDWELSYYLSDKDPETGLWRSKEPSDFHGFGDVERGFRECDVMVEESGLRYAYCKSPAMNPRGCVVDYQDGTLTVHTHSQAMHNERTTLAMALGVPIKRVKYVSPFTGSSFGGKSARPGNMNEGSHYLMIACLAALTLKRAVRCAYTREEEMLCSWSRGSRASVKLGFTRDGILETIDLDHWQEVGAGGDIWPPKNALLATGTVLYAHNCRNMRGRIHYVYTNRFLSHGWQGYGAPEGHFAMETAMDIAAEKLGMDPIELRKKNHMRAGDIDSGFDPLEYKACFISSSGISECLDAGARRLDWYKQWRPPAEKTGRIRRGLGVAIFCMGAGRPGRGNSSSAMVKIYPDGSADLYSALADIGQGQHTVQCQIVAEVLNVPYERVGLICENTDATPYATITANSAGTWIHGWATYEAALEAKNKLLALAAEKLNIGPDALETDRDGVFVQADPETRLSYPDVFAPYSAYGGGQEVVGYYWNDSPHPRGLKDGDPEQVFIPKEKGAQFVSLDVDTETGLISNIRVIVAQNVGRALNPKIVEGQLLTARHGVENAVLGNDCIVDRKTGRLLNGNWIEYRPSSILDCDIEPIVVEKPGDPTHPFGATACGEGAACPTLAVFSNAIYNAAGVRLKETPFTPDKILQALGKDGK